MEIKIVKKLAEHIDPYMKDKMVNFLCEALTSSTITSPELKEAKWFELKEIKMLENIHMGLKRFLMDYLGESPTVL